MTYCVGMCLAEGAVLMADTRTNAGLDNIATFSKMHVFEAPGERVVVLMTAICYVGIEVSANFQKILLGIQDWLKQCKP